LIVEERIKQPKLNSEKQVGPAKPKREGPETEFTNQFLLIETKDSTALKLFPSGLDESMASEKSRPPSLQNDELAFSGVPGAFSIDDKDNITTTILGEQAAVNSTVSEATPTAIEEPTKGLSSTPTTSHGGISANPGLPHSKVPDEKVGPAENISDTKPSRPQRPTRQQRQSWRYLRAFFKNIGLQATNALFHWRPQEEKPKTVIEKNRRMALLRLTIHIPPLIGCAVLFYYNLKTVILPASPAYTILQFVAKLLEIFMQASITAIILSQIRYEISDLGQSPFGSLFVGVRVTDIAYLWSSEFFGVISSR
jgi:hypothetical protein